MTNLVQVRPLFTLTYNALMFIMQLVVDSIFALLVGGIFFMRDDTPRGMMDRCVLYYSYSI